VIGEVCSKIDAIKPDFFKECLKVNVESYIDVPKTP